MEKKLLLIDGNSLINRAFYAFGANGTQFSHKGKPTGATYGFLNMLFKGIEDLKPTHIAVAFDVRAKTFRHNLFTEYKAGRRTTPDDLISQIADLKELLDIMGVSIIEKQGFEADDIIGTLSQESDMPVIILTADRDAFQLISDNNVKGQSVELHLTKTGVTSLDIWTNNRVILEKEIIPSQFIDIKSLQGDTSDNIPGAKGIGEKTALQLVQQFSSIDNLYNSIDKVTSATTRQKLVDSKEMVYKSYQLAKIITDVPLDINFDGFKFTMPLGGETYTAFNERGFKSLIKRSNLWGDIKHAPTNSERKENIPTQINEVKTIQDLITAVNLIITSKDCIGISIEYNDEFFSLSQKNSVNEYHQYKIHVLKNLIDGGLDYEEIIQTLKPFFQCDIPKFVVDSKELKKLLATRKIELNNVKIDAKICAYLLGCEPNLTIYFSQKLREREMFDLYQNIELPLVDILLEMERNGAKLSNDALTRVSDELTQEINDISEQIYSQAGERFNINSPKILSDILYKKLGLDTLQKTKTGFSTNEEVLQKLKNKHQIVPLILRYRKIFKLNSTYVNGYKNLMDEQGFIHTTFNNTVTVTGRLSSSEPNLQNIPARSEEAKRIRQLFTSRFTKDNNKGFLLCADYSQIELRILAHLSGDESMISAFTNNRDIHTETALKIFDVPDSLQIISDMRRIAKAVNFGIIYGISAFGLSNSLGVTTSEATKFIEKYFAQFPKIKAFLDGCRDFALEHGYVKTMYGRRRYLPELQSTNANMVQFGTRAAMNMPMQGTAADIIKSAMIDINKELKSNHNLKSLMIAQIHDELVFDVPENEVDAMKNLVKQCMENVIKLAVPLQVDISVKETL